MPNGLPTGENIVYTTKQNKAGRPTCPTVKHAPPSPMSLFTKTDL